MAIGNAKAGGVKKSGLGISTFAQSMEDYNPATDGALISRSKYNAIMGLCLLWGFLANVVVCSVFGDFFVGLASKYFIVFIIAYIVCAVVGILINTKSDNPAISFLGYNLVVLPLGACLSVIIVRYPVVSVLFAFVATAVVTLVMVVLSTAKPDFFLGIGKSLFVALLVAIVAEIVLTFVMGVDLSIFDWIVALIFCGYIGYDWARAQSIPSTLDNAVDSACALYIDIVNLFIRLLEIVGRK